MCGAAAMGRGLYIRRRRSSTCALQAASARKPTIGRSRPGPHASARVQGGAGSSVAVYGWLQVVIASCNSHRRHKLPPHPSPGFLCPPCWCWQAGAPSPNQQAHGTATQLEHRTIITCTHHTIQPNQQPGQSTYTFLNPRTRTARVCKRAHTHRPHLGSARTRSRRRRRAAGSPRTPCT